MQELLDPATRDKGKFAPKLDLNTRRTILGLAAMSVKHELLAEVYGVNYRTVSAMVSRSSAHYKGLRKEYDQMGHEAFLKAYVSEDQIRRVNEHARGRVKEEKGPAGPSPKANAKAGPHVAEDTARGAEVVVVVEWHDDEHNGERRPGWYWRIQGEDGLFGPHFTSSKAIEDAERGGMAFNGNAG
jgi:hypothetical protein